MVYPACLANAFCTQEIRNWGHITWYWWHIPTGHSMEDSLGLAPARPRRPLLARAVSSEVSDPEVAAEVSTPSLSPPPLSSDESLSCASAALCAAPAWPDAAAAAREGSRTDEIGLRSMKGFGRWLVCCWRSRYCALPSGGGCSKAAAASSQNRLGPATSVQAGAFVSSLPGHLRIAHLLQTNHPRKGLPSFLCSQEMQPFLGSTLRACGHLMVFQCTRVLALRTRHRDMALKIMQGKYRYCMVEIHRSTSSHVAPRRRRGFAGCLGGGTSAPRQPPSAAAGKQAAQSCSTTARPGASIIGAIIPASVRRCARILPAQNHIETSLLPKSVPTCCLPVFIHANNQVQRP